MILNRNENECCGCTACQYICPVQAISMEMDDEGFRNPVIDQQKCIQCEMCLNVCVFKNITVKERYEQKVFGMKINNRRKRNISQSGGAFTAIAETVLQKNGVVYGVELNKDLQSIYSRVDSIEHLDKIKGSKYVQADNTGVFDKVLEDLKIGKIVLYSGTPCNSHALSNFLSENNIDTKNFYTCDLICHGVPSPKLFNEYIDVTEKYYKKKVYKYNYRDKTLGWHNHKESIQFSNSSIKLITDNFVKLFYSHLILRPSCYNCPYTNIIRHSDITLADFWGVEKFYPSWDDHKGISLVLVNTKKGENIFNQAKDISNAFRTTIDKCVQPNLYNPTSCPPQRDIFWDEYRIKGLEYVMTKYSNYDTNTNYYMGNTQKAKNYLRKNMRSLFCLFFKIKEIANK